MSHSPALATSVKSPNPFCPVRPWVRGSTHRLQIAGHWLGGGISPRNSGEPVLASIVYQATPRHPLVLAGVVLAMSLLGLVATWIPARRALSVNPTILLREE